MSRRDSELSGCLSSGPTIALAVIAALVVILIIGFSTIGGYVAHGVGATEIGIKFRSNQIVDIVGPGIYNDLSFFADMKNIDVSGIAFQVEDKEVLTKDQQRIGVVVFGTVHRPDLKHVDFLRNNWQQYSTFYTNNEALAGRQTIVKDKEGRDVAVWQGGLMQSLGQQAQKVCVGDLNFSQAVIGSARDVLRECINTELDKLAGGYGLEVNNIVVPQIELSQEVQQQMDAITKARFDTQIAQQQTLKAQADGERNLMVTQAEIRVDQGKIQETARQNALTADLNQKALVAQRAVIEQEKANELFTAQQDLTIQQKQQEVAAARAKADLANQTAVAAIYEQNPRYADLEKARLYSAAYSKTDKVIIPAGSDPYLFVGTQPNAVVTTR